MVGESAGVLAGILAGMDRGAWWVVVHGVAELDTTEHARTMIF